MADDWHSSATLLRLFRNASMTRLFAALVGIACFSVRAHAQSTALLLWTRDSIHSQVLGETRALRISLPVGYDARDYAAERYPVLIVLDADADIPFAATIANARAMGGTNAPAMPRLIIVGVETGGRNRFRDLTLPTADDTAHRVDGGGGAPAFLRFLSTELQPYLATRYRTLPFTVLSGHSLSGSFARWAFGQAPQFLAGAIALSPSPLETARILDGIQARGTPGRLIVVTGTAEGGLDSAAQSFAAALRSRNVAALAFAHERIADVSHDHTATLGMIPGLRFIFRPGSLSAYQIGFDEVSATSAMLSRFNAVFDSTRAAYLRGAAELGLPQRLPLSFLVSQGNWYQAPATAPLLMRLCQEMVGFYPTLFRGFECAGDAQTRLGHSAEAAASYRRAIDAARALGDSAAADRIARKAATSSGKPLRRTR